MDAMDIDDESEELVDYTKIPAELESRYSELDVDNALRPTIINTGTDSSICLVDFLRESCLRRLLIVLGDIWTKSYRTSLLADESKMTLHTDEQGKERNKAFDLLDALTKSGAIAIDDAVHFHTTTSLLHRIDDIFRRYTW